MEIWPQRDKFKTLVLAYQKKHDIKPEQMAELLGISPSHLHGLRYDKRTRIGLETAQAASKVLGVSLSELVDDPGQDLPGVASQAELSELSEAKRLVMKMIFHDLKSEDVTDEQAMAYRNALRSIQEMGKLRK